jgi:hypothetical protein
LLITTPAGRLSVSEKFVNEVSVGARIFILNLELPPASIVDGLNALLDRIPDPTVYTLIGAVAGRTLVTP